MVPKSEQISACAGGEKVSRQWSFCPGVDGASPIRSQCWLSGAQANVLLGHHLQRRAGKSSSIQEDLFVGI